MKFKKGDEVIVTNSDLTSYIGKIGFIMGKNVTRDGWNVLFNGRESQILMFEWELKKVTPLDKLL